MKLKLVTLMGAAVFASFMTGVAQECSEVLKLSQLEEGQTSNSESLLETANDYCRTYEKAKRSATAASVTIPTKLGNVGGSSSSNRAKSIYENLCKSDESGEAKSNAYETYVRSVAPGAFDAYSACVSNTNRNFSVRVGDSTETFVPITVSFRPRGSESGRINIVRSPEISCSDGYSRQFDEAGSWVFTCSRENGSKRGSITIIDELDGTGLNQLSLPWTAYVNGVPSNLANRYKAEIEALEALSNALQNAVIAFDAAQCPAGFERYVPAQGRFLRGIDPTNALDKERAELPISQRAGTTQRSSFGSHNHWLKDGGEAEWEASVTTRRSGKPYQRVGNGSGEGDQVLTSTAGEGETRPENVAVSFCKKT